MIRWKSGIIGLCLVLLLASCKPGKDTNIPDVSEIDINIDITRFDQLLLSDTTIDAARLQKLVDEHPAFSRVFFQHIMPKPDDIVVAGDPELEMQQIRSWVNHPRTRWLYDTIQQIYPDVKELETELESAFRYAKYYFPENETPRIYTTTSDFGYFPFVYAEDSTRDGIGISLEMFLGDDFPYLKYTGLNNAFSDYLTRSYNKEHIVRRTLEVWVDDLIGNPPGNKLIDYMIHNGKKLYIIESLMPEAHDSVIIDYPSDKLKWVDDNERSVWYHFRNEEMLYETSLNKIQKYIGPSPSSPGMPAASPGNTASWLGWKIIKAYKTKHPETTLKQLIELRDSQKILDESGYRPPR